MSNANLIDKKAVCIQQTELGNTVAKGLARALEARKMAEVTSTDDLNGVGGGLSLSKVVLFPWGIFPPYILPDTLAATQQVVI